MKEYYLKNEKNEDVLVGYKVKNLYDLAEAGYFITKNYRDDFIKYRKKGVVYVDLDSNFLYFRKKLIIPIKPKEIYALNWDEYLKECV